MLSNSENNAKRKYNNKNVQKNRKNLKNHLNKKGVAASMLLKSRSTGIPFIVFATLNGRQFSLNRNGYITETFRYHSPKFYTHAKLNRGNIPYQVFNKLSKENKIIIVASQNFTSDPNSFEIRANALKNFWPIPKRRNNNTNSPGNASSTTRKKNTR